MTRKLIVAPRPREQIRQALRWWRENRPKAPRALAEDLRKAFRLIREHPGVGTRLEGPHDDVYRLLLRRVRYALYYRANDESVAVAELWHASRGETPALT